MSETTQIASPHREKAHHLLMYYLTLAGQGLDFEAGDNEQRHDYRVEVQEIVDHIVEAAKHEIRHEMAQELRKMAQEAQAKALKAGRELADQFMQRLKTVAAARGKGGGV